MNLHDYSIIIINTSGGKDSLVATYEICRMAEDQGYPKNKIHLSHQDLGESEWKGTTDLVKKHSEFFGLQLHISKRRNNKGYEETFLEYALRRGKWPSSEQRWCTSDYKRGPGARVVTMLTAGMDNCKVLYVFGFRKQESPSRKKKRKTATNKKLTTLKRTTIDFLPVHGWSTKKVWDTIKANKLPYHFAYNLGMPRLSCVFCIFSPFDALVIAGYQNPDLLQKYVDVEKQINHTFKKDFAIAEVQQAINNGYQPQKVTDWVM